MQKFTIQGHDICRHVIIGHNLSYSETNLYDFSLEFFIRMCASTFSALPNFSGFVTRPFLQKLTFSANVSFLVIPWILKVTDLTCWNLVHYHEPLFCAVISSNHTVWCMKKFMFWYDRSPPILKQTRSSVGYVRFHAAQGYNKSAANHISIFPDLLLVSSFPSYFDHKTVLCVSPHACRECQQGVQQQLWKWQSLCCFCDTLVRSKLTPVHLMMHTVG